MKSMHGFAKVALAALLVAGAGMAADVAQADGKRHRSEHGDHDGNDDGRYGWDDDGCRTVVVKQKHRHARYRNACEVPHPRYGRVNFGLYRRGSAWYACPTTRSPFVTRRARVIVVRPVPVWACAPSRSGVAASILFRDGNTSLALAFADRDPQFGCSLCGENFGSYGRWERHSRGCAGGEFRGAVVFESWDDEDLDYFRARLETSGLSG